MALNGPRNGAPCKAPTYIGDDLAGLHGALAAMMALHHRERTGEGQHIDSALLDAVLFQSNGYLTLAAMGEPTPRMGSEVTVTCPVNVFECRDGYIFLAVALDSHWVALCDVMGRPQLATAPGFATNAARVLNRDAVNEVVAGWCRTVPATEADARIGAAGIAVALVDSYEDAARNPHVIERDMLQEATLEDGTVALLTGPAAKFSRTPTRVRHAARAVGADTDDIVAELGLDDEAVGKLRAEGVL
jgi:formyl-CoA transferase